MEIQEEALTKDVTRPLTVGEFEDLQLKAHMVFCRACGLINNAAVPMEHHAKLWLSSEVFPSGPGTFHVYKCPRCGHRAMSEKH